jgi:RNA polymerase sigma factor for flagellar operon FliA
MKIFELLRDGARHLDALALSYFGENRKLKGPLILSLRSSIVSGWVIEEDQFYRLTDTGRALLPPKEEEEEDTELDPTGGLLTQEHWYRLVHKIARGVWSPAMRQTADIPDLVTAGFFGLMRASKNYEKDSGVQFSTYASYRIRGSMLDYLRSQDHMPRMLRTEMREFQQREEVHIRTMEDLLKVNGEAKEERRLELSTALSRPIRLGWDNGDNKDGTPFEIPSDFMRPDAYGDNDFEWVRALVRKLPEKTQLVVQRYYLDDYSMKEVGTMMKISESRVSQICKEGISLLKQFADRETLVKA